MAGLLPASDSRLINCGNAARRPIFLGRRSRRGKNARINSARIIAAAASRGTSCSPASGAARRDPLAPRESSALSILACAGVSFSFSRVYVSSEYGFRGVNMGFEDNGFFEIRRVAEVPIWESGGTEEFGDFFKANVRTAGA